MPRFEMPYKQGQQLFEDSPYSYGKALMLLEMMDQLSDVLDIRASVNYSDLFKTTVAAAIRDAADGLAKSSRPNNRAQAEAFRLFAEMFEPVFKEEIYLENSEENPPIPVDESGS